MKDLPPEIWDFTRSASGTLAAMGKAGHFGVLRLMGDRIATQELPSDVMPAYRATALRPSALSTLASEIVNSEHLAADVERLGDLGDLPLVVVSAGKSFDTYRTMAPDWPFDQANQTWSELQDDLVSLSTRSWHHVSSESTHDIHSDDPALVIASLRELVDTVRASRRQDAAMPWLLVLPATSDPEVDRLLEEMEEAYASMDVDRWVSLFTDDVDQMDVPRRVHVSGREAWRAQTEQINAAHVRMGRIHHGRARIGDWIVVEIEWTGTVRGAAVGTPRTDRDYQYSGLALLELAEGKVRRQIIYGDVTTLDEQLGS